MREELLTPWMIEQGYWEGAFPMGTDPGEIEWFVPRVRAVFPMEGMHVSHSLRKVLRRREFDIRFDTSYEAVMRSCLRPDGNWINEQIIQVYCELFRQGRGHCSECWVEGELVGGVYGVSFGTVFCAESMFHRRTNASKVALWALIEKCREAGYTIFDAQVMSSHLESLGAVPMAQRGYVTRFRRESQGETNWNPDPGTLVFP